MTGKSQSNEEGSHPARSKKTDSRPVEIELKVEAHLTNLETNCFENCLQNLGFEETLRPAARVHEAKSLVLAWNLERFQRNRTHFWKKLR